MENAEITELKVKPGHVITVKENGGILAGRAKHSVIRNVTVNGTLRTTGTAGGVIADVLEDSVVENCIRPCGYRCGKRKGDLCRGIADGRQSL
ncbi:MAG: hypothetical protein ACLTFJ_10840 [Clostridium sp.]